MAKSITSYRVFIASPGGLGKERQCFKDVLTAHNEADAMERNAHFAPIGWEMTLGGVGRPQAKINEEVLACDYFVLLLWDRWGTPTGSKAGHSSGTEEEYHAALEAYANEAHPMREIVVLFKAVDPRQLSDPGPQLTAVLNFKKTLEQEKKLLFQTFDDLDSFADKLRRHLAKWTRDHESNGNANSEIRTAPITNGAEAAADSTNIDFKLDNPKGQQAGFIHRIESLYNAGKLTDAEAQLVGAIMPGDNLVAYRTYGNFLVKAGRLTDAETVFDRLLRFAEKTNELSWQATALAGLGGVYRMKDRFEDARVRLVRALELKKQSGDREGHMYVTIWLGDLYSHFKKWQTAEVTYVLALKEAKELGLKICEADLHFKIAKCALHDKRPADATNSAKQAEVLFTELKDKASLQSLKQWRKSKRRELDAPK